MGNKIRLTCACFLAYVVTSALLNPSGILLGPLAEKFSVTPAAVGDALGAFNIGIVIGAIVAVPLLARLGQRPAMLLAYAVVLVSLLVVSVAASLAQISLALAVAGAACGVGLPAAASIIATLHDGDRRASMLIVTDGAFSMAAFASVAIGSFVLLKGATWAAVYGFAGVAAALVLLLMSVTPFVAPTALEQQRVSWRRWPAAVWLSALALGLYTFGQFSLLLWLPTYAEEVLGAERAASAVPLERYWIAMLIGQVIAAGVVLKAGLSRLMLTAAALAAALVWPMLVTDSVAGLAGWAAAWGIGTLGLLKLILTFGSLQLGPDARALVPTLLLAATTGTALAPRVSAAVVTMNGTGAALPLAAGALLVSLFAVVIARVVSRPWVSVSAT